MCYGSYVSQHPTPTGCRQVHCTQPCSIQLSPIEYCFPSYSHRAAKRDVQHKEYQSPQASKVPIFKCTLDKTDLKGISWDRTSALTLRVEVTLHWCCWTCRPQQTGHEEHQCAMSRHGIHLGCSIALRIAFSSFAPPFIPPRVQGDGCGEWFTPYLRCVSGVGAG